VLDIRLIRSDPDRVRGALARRGPGAAEAVDRLLELDREWRELTTELEQLRSEQNQASRALRGAPTPEQREQLAALAARGRAVSDQ
jgi:seryl-tRNA synthetase